MAKKSRVVEAIKASVKYHITIPPGYVEKSEGKVALGDRFWILKEKDWLDYQENIKEIIGLPVDLFYCVITPINTDGEDGPVKGHAE